MLEVLRLDQPDSVDVVEHRLAKHAAPGLILRAKLLVGSVPCIVLEADDEVGLLLPHPVLRGPPQADVPTHPGELTKLVKHPAAQKLGRLLKRCSFELDHGVLRTVNVADELHSVPLDAGDTRRHWHQIAPTRPEQISSVISPLS